MVARKASLEAAAGGTKNKKKRASPAERLVEVPMQGSLILDKEPHLGHRHVGVRTERGHARVLAVDSVGATEKLAGRLLAQHQLLLRAALRPQHEQVRGVGLAV